jgi:hypothetical protein
MIEPGMSGSPILADDETAIGVVSIGTESINGGNVRKHIKSGPPTCPHAAVTTLALAVRLLRK